MSRISASVDVTNVVCPMTFVKVAVAMEEIEAGQLLEIRLNDGEAIKNIPRSLKDDGHLVVSVERAVDNTFQVIVKKEGIKNIDK